MGSGAVPQGQARWCQLNSTVTQVAQGVQQLCVWAGSSLPWELGLGAHDPQLRVVGSLLLISLQPTYVLFVAITKFSLEPVASGKESRQDAAGPPLPESAGLLSHPIFTHREGSGWDRTAALPSMVIQVIFISNLPQLLHDPDLWVHVCRFCLRLLHGSHCTQIMIEGLARRTWDLC